ncbi:hypothetical protein JTE90_012540 [Oedothorax gibbosus]|uniref:Uncharacterized protein n=1 Tax=Oedothorax gibbosus TaxID=931172 RepID=A0AAV6U653_9ARAC|nr:hypothetical protein JTE90_012540 [Oedothorax gibbosus]
MDNTRVLPTPLLMDADLKKMTTIQKKVLNRDSCIDPENLNAIQNDCMNTWFTYLPSTRVSPTKKAKASDNIIHSRATKNLDVFLKEHKRYAVDSAFICPASKRQKTINVFVNYTPHSKSPKKAYHTVLKSRTDLFSTTMKEKIAKDSNKQPSHSNMKARKETTKIYIEKPTELFYLDPNLDPRSKKFQPDKIQLKEVDVESWTDKEFEKQYFKRGVEIINDIVSGILTPPLEQEIRDPRLKHSNIFTNFTNAAYGIGQNSPSVPKESSADISLHQSKTLPMPDLQVKSNVQLSSDSSTMPLSPTKVSADKVSVKIVHASFRATSNHRDVHLKLPNTEKVASDPPNVVPETNHMSLKLNTASSFQRNASLSSAMQGNPANRQPILSSLSVNNAKRTSSCLKSDNHNFMHREMSKYSAKNDSLSLNKCDSITSSVPTAPSLVAPKEKLPSKTSISTKILSINTDSNVNSSNKQKYKKVENLLSSPKCKKKRSYDVSKENNISPLRFKASKAQSSCLLSAGISSKSSSTGEPVKNVCFTLRPHQDCEKLDEPTPNSNVEECSRTSPSKPKNSPRTTFAVSKKIPNARKHETPILSLKCKKKSTKEKPKEKHASLSINSPLNIQSSDASVGKTAKVLPVTTVSKEVVSRASKKQRIQTLVGPNSKCVNQSIKEKCILSGTDVSNTLSSGEFNELNTFPTSTLSQKVSSTVSKKYKPPAVNKPLSSTKPQKLMKNDISNVKHISSSEIQTSKVIANETLSTIPSTVECTTSNYILSKKDSSTVSKKSKYMKFKKPKQLRMSKCDFISKCQKKLCHGASKEKLHPNFEAIEVSSYDTSQNNVKKTSKTLSTDTVPTTAHSKVSKKRKNSESDKPRYKHIKKISDDSNIEQVTSKVLSSKVFVKSSSQNVCNDCEVSNNMVSNKEISHIKAQQERHSTSPNVRAKKHNFFARHFEFLVKSLIKHFKDAHCKSNLPCVTSDDEISNTNVVSFQVDTFVQKFLFAFASLQYKNDKLSTIWFKTVCLPMALVHRLGYECYLNYVSSDSIAQPATALDIFDHFLQKKLSTHLLKQTERDLKNSLKYFSLRNILCKFKMKIRKCNAKKSQKCLVDATDPLAKRVTTADSFRELQENSNEHFGKECFKIENELIADIFDSKNISTSLWLETNLEWKAFFQRSNLIFCSENLKRNSIFLSPKKKFPFCLENNFSLIKSEEIFFPLMECLPPKQFLYNAYSKSRNFLRSLSPTTTTEILESIYLSTYDLESSVFMKERDHKIFFSLQEFVWNNYQILNLCKLASLKINHCVGKISSCELENKFFSQGLEFSNRKKLASESKTVSTFIRSLLKSESSENDQSKMEFKKNEITVEKESTDQSGLLNCTDVSSEEKGPFDDTDVSISSSISLPASKEQLCNLTAAAQQSAPIGQSHSLIELQTFDYPTLESTKINDTNFVKTLKTETNIAMEIPFLDCLSSFEKENTRDVDKEKNGPQSLQNSQEALPSTKECSMTNLLKYCSSPSTSKLLQATSKIVDKLSALQNVSYPSKVTDPFNSLTQDAAEPMNSSFDVCSTSFTAEATTTSSIQKASSENISTLNASQKNKTPSSPDSVKTFLASSTKITAESSYCPVDSSDASSHIPTQKSSPCLPSVATKPTTDKAPANEIYAHCPTEVSLELSRNSKSTLVPRDTLAKGSSSSTLRKPVQGARRSSSSTLHKPVQGCTAVSVCPTVTIHHHPSVPQTTSTTKKNLNCDKDSDRKAAISTVFHTDCPFKKLGKESKVSSKVLDSAFLDFDLFGEGKPLQYYHKHLRASGHHTVNFDGIHTDMTKLSSDTLESYNFLTEQLHYHRLILRGLIQLASDPEAEPDEKMYKRITEELEYIEGYEMACKAILL